VNAPTNLTIAISTAALGAALVVSAPAAAATATVSRPATASAVAYGSTWTVDTAADSITGYAPSASGAATPVATISGPDTGLSGPAGVAVGPTGTVYAVNTANDSITAYAAGSNGDAAPSATISGPSTGLDGPSSIAIGSGQLWVTDPASNVVEAFDTSDQGNALPAETIHGWRTKLHHPTAVAVDNGLGQVTVLNQPSGGTPSLTSYVPFFRLPIEFGNIAPIANATGGLGTPLLAPTALAASSLDGSVWVTDSSTHSAQELALFGPNIFVLGRIKGADTGLADPTGVAVDALGRPIVAEASTHSVLVFAANAHGDASPTSTITSVGSDAGSPAAVAVSGAPPSPPAAVQAHVHGDRATVHWTAPATTGGGVAGYELEMIVVTRNGFGLITSEGASGSSGPGLSTKTSATLGHLPTKGRIRFAVAAINNFGFSQSALSNPIRAFARPSAPTDVVALGAAGTMTVGWHPPAQAGGKPITHYRVEYGTCTPGATGCHYRSVTVRESTHHVRIDGLAVSRTYFVRVLAQSRIGIGKPSTPVKVRT
jgi:hypothetical protein